MFVTKLFSGRSVDWLCQATQFISEEVSSMRWTRHPRRSELSQCYLVSGGRFWAVLAASAAGFNHPAAICASDVMLIEPAPLYLCQFKPAVPVRQLTPCTRSVQFLLAVELCNRLHTTESMTSCYFPSLTLISHLLSLASRHFSSPCLPSRSSAGAAGPVHQGQLSTEGPRANRAVPPETG